MKKINHCFTPDSLESVLSKMVSPTSSEIYKWQKCRIIRINLSSKVQCFCGSYRSSRSQMFLKICVLKNFAKFTGKRLCWSLFLMMLQAWRAATLLKRKKNSSISVLLFFNFYLAAPVKFGPLSRRHPHSTLTLTHLLFTYSTRRS